MTEPPDQHGPTPEPDPPAEPPAAPGPSRGERRRALVVEARAVLAVVGVLAVAGGPLGLLWAAMAPSLMVVRTPDGPAWADIESETFAAADGWFVLLGVVFGLLAAALCWGLVRRFRGPVMLAGLAGGLLAGARVAVLVGAELGRSHYEYLTKHAHQGVAFAHPVELGARGALVVPALLAVFLYTILAGWSRYPGLDRRRALTGGA